MFFYITDIATTVAFWEALTMLIVEQKEKRKSLLDLRTHFDSIRFEQEQAGE